MIIDGKERASQCRLEETTRKTKIATLKEGDKSKGKTMKRKATTISMRFEFASIRSMHSFEIKTESLQNARFSDFMLVPDQRLKLQFSPPNLLRETHLRKNRQFNVSNKNQENRFNEKINRQFDILLPSTSHTLIFLNVPLLIL